MNPDNWDEQLRRLIEEQDAKNAERLRRMMENVMRKISEDEIGPSQRERHMRKGALSWEGALPEPAVKYARCPCCSGSGTLRLTTNAVDDRTEG